MKPSLVTLLAATLLAPVFATLARAASEPPRLVLPSSHGEAVISIALTPDGRWAVSGTRKGQLKLWDVATGAEARTINVGKLGAETLIGLYPRNDTQLYAVCTRTVFMLEIPSLRVANELSSPADLTSARVSEDGETLWLGASNHSKQQFFVLRRGRFPLRPLAERARTGSPTWGIPHLSPDGSLALITDAPNTPTVLVSTADGKVVHTLPPRPSNSGSATWAPDGRIIVSEPTGPSSKLNRLTFLSPTTVKAEWSTEVPTTTAGSTHALFNDNRTGGPVLLGGHGLIFIDGTKVDGPFRTEGYYLTAAAISRDGRSVVVGTTQGGIGKLDAHHVLRFDRARGAFTPAWSSSAYQPTLLSGSPRGDALFISDRREDAKLLRLGPSGLQVAPIAVPWCFDGEFLPSGQLVYNYGDHDKRTSAILDVDRPAAPRLVKLPFESVGRSLIGSLVLSPSGKLAVDHRAGSTPVQVYEIQTGRVLHNLPNGYFSYSQTSGSATFSPDEKAVAYFISQAQDKGGRSVVLVDLATGARRWTHDKLNLDIGAMRFSPDGKELYVLGIYSSPWIYVLNASTGAKLREYYLPSTYVAAGAIFTPDGKHIALPNGKSVILADAATGKEVKTLHDEAQTAERLAFLGKDRLVTTGADNAIRLWDVPSATLLGTFSLSKDGKQWAFVHPSGRFEATDGFQEQMYFMQGATKVPLAAYFEAYFTPGLVGQVMSGQKIEPPAVQLKDLAQPPKVFVDLAGTPAGARNLTVEDAPRTVTTETATLAITAQAVDSPVAEIRVYHNGKLIEARTRNLTVEDDIPDTDLGPGGKRETVTVALLPGENTFRVVALNAQRTESKPAQLVLDYRPATPVADSGRTGGGLQLHLLVVGINTYKNPKYNLNYAVPDANAIRALIEKSAAGIFTRVNVTTLLDDKATRAALLESFASIARASGPRDVFVFYYAGHGVMSGEAKPEFFLAPHEITQLYGDDSQLRAKAVSSAELLAASQKISAQKQLFLLDACQSAGALQAVAKRGAAEEKAVAQLARASGTHWITASGSEQFASEFEKLGHGTFTYALLEALKGKADNGDGRITVNELKAFLEIQVPELTKTHKGTPQYPASYGFGQDFPVSVAVR